MKILITGANGYVGKSLYNAFKDKYDVTIITRKEVDLVDSKQVNHFFKDKYFDVILNCAVVGGSRLKEDSWEIMDMNLTMYYNLLQHQNKFKKFIHFGSGAQIYKSGSPYGFSKKIISQSIREKPNFYEIVIYGVFDENELDTRFIKASINRYINKKPILIHQEKNMSFFYMPDLIKLVEYSLENSQIKELVECSYLNTPTSLVEIANIINNLDNYKVEIKIDNPNHGGIYKGVDPLDLDLEYIGLKQGIKNVYNKLKDEY